MFIGADTKSGQAGNGEGKVIVTGFQQPLHGSLAGQRINIRDDFLGVRRKKPLIVQLADRIVYPHGCRPAGYDK